MDWFILAFISAVFSAASAVSEKKTLFSLNAVEFSFFVSAVTLLLSAPFFFSIDLSSVFSFRIYLLFIKTIIGAAAFLCVMQAIKDLEISKALPLLALSPGFVAIAGVIFIDDFLSPYEWAGLLLIAGGAFTLESEKSSFRLFSRIDSSATINSYPIKPESHLIKYKYIFIALFLFTVSSVLDRLLLKDLKLPPFTFMAFQQLFYALFFAVIFFVKRKDQSSLFSLGKNSLYLVIAVSVFTVIYRYTQIEAIKLAPVALVLSVKRLSVLMAVIAGGRLFKEDNLTMRVFAVILILAGTALLI